MVLRQCFFKDCLVLLQRDLGVEDVRGEDAELEGIRGELAISISSPVPGDEHDLDVLGVVSVDRFVTLWNGGDLFLEAELPRLLLLLDELQRNALALKIGNELEFGLLELLLSLLGDRINGALHEEVEVRLH